MRAQRYDTDFTNFREDPSIRDGFDEPFIDELPEGLCRIRKNLLLYSSINLLTMYLRWTKAIKKDETFELSFLINIKANISINLLFVILCIMISYYLFYFFIKAKESYLRNKIRLTGIYNQYPIGFGNSFYGTSYSSDNRQHNLFPLLLNLLEQFKRAHTGEENLAIQDYLRSFETSLARFDQGFKRYKIIERIRCLYIELWLPAIIGITSILGNIVLYKIID